MKNIETMDVAKLLVTAALSLGAASQAAALEFHPFGTNAPAVDFHGFASQGFLYSTEYNYLADNSTDGSFKFSEAGLNASMNPFPRTRITAQTFLFDVGNVGQYDLLLDYASIEYTFSDKFSVRGGRVRRPSGIYNHIQDVDLARTYVLLPQGMYDSRWRDFSGSLDGGEIYGNFSLGKAGGVSYESYVGMVNMAANGGVARSLQNSLPAPYPYSQYRGIDSCMIVGSQFWWNTPVDGLRAGVSVGYLQNFGYSIYVDPLVGGPGLIHEKGNIPFQQYSLEYTWKSWTFQGEYYTYNFTGHDYVGGFPIKNVASEPGSWYVGASHRFNKWLEVGAYYTEFYADKNDRGGTTAQHQRDTTLSLRFDPKDWWIIKLEGHYINGTALLNDDAHNPNRDDRGWFMLAVKTTFTF
jgi:hypothetical protein